MTIPEYLASIGWREATKLFGVAQRFARPDNDYIVHMLPTGWAIFDGAYDPVTDGHTVESLRTAIEKLPVRKPKVKEQAMKGHHEHEPECETGPEYEDDLDSLSISVYVRVDIPALSDYVAYLRDERQQQQKVDVLVHHQLDRIEYKLDRILNLERQESMTLTELKAKVERNTTVTASAVDLIKGLAQQIRDSANDPAALQELANSLDASDNGLADAVTANTPANG